MFKVAETSVETASTISTDDSTSEVWRKLDLQFNQIKPFIESTVDRWNEHTQISQPLKKKSAFNQTIVQQVNSMIDDAHSLDKLL